MWGRNARVPALLLLLPCSAQKRLQPSVAMRAHERLYTPAEFASTWKERIRAASPKVTVGALYKGPAWAVARDIQQAAVSRGGRVLVVSAGLGLAELTDSAPGYDITLAGGAATTAPGCATAAGRAEWWAQLGGAESLREHVASGIYTSVVAALPAAYVDAVVVAFAELAREHKHLSFTILCTRPSRFALETAGGLLVAVDPRRTRTLGGTVSCAPQVALRHVLRQVPARTAVTREVLSTAIVEWPQVAAVYPRRTAAGVEHAERWLHAELASSAPPTSATAALRKYRAAGFAFEQRAFHSLYAATRRSSTPSLDIVERM